MSYKSLLVAPLLFLIGTGCRTENTEGQPDQMINPEDLSVVDDLSVSLPDLANTPPDLIGADLTAPPLPSDFFVVRVGDGTATLSSAATATFLERRKLSDGSLVGAPLPLPVAVSGANRIFTLSGSST
ncbi:MAG TPA: hypothetical protein PLY80_12040, partial [Pseudomonadota bacterium]|nr:hypothetical protein [Pseudomonadota bacterium]